MPEITVIVPVYNVEHYLRRCVDSILAQTFTDFELILVDDGSTDGSGVICDEYAERNARIKALHQRNRGQSAARNAGLRQSSAEWVSFVDADDMIHPQLLQLLYDAVCEYQVQIASCCCCESTDIPDSFLRARKCQFVPLKIDEAVLSDLMQEKHYWIACGKLIHRRIVEALPFEEGRIYEDNAVVCQWLYTAGKIAISSEPLYFYYINPDGTTKSGFSLKRLDYIWATRQQELFYQKIGYVNLAEKTARTQLELYLMYCSVIKLELGNAEALRRLKNELGHFLWEHRRLKLTLNMKKRLLYLYVPPVQKLCRGLKSIWRKRPYDP